MLACLIDLDSCFFIEILKFQTFLGDNKWVDLDSCFFIEILKLQTFLGDNKWVHLQCCYDVFHEIFHATTLWIGLYEEEVASLKLCKKMLRFVHRLEKLD